MKNCKLAILAIMALSACCQLTETDQWKGPVVVGFSTGYSSKVSADAAAGRLEWEEGDNIVLWALNTAGEETVGSQPFHYLAGRQDLSQAYFSAAIPQAMPEGEYLYRTLSPVPDSYADGLASYTISSSQQSDRTPYLLWGSCRGHELTAFDESLPIPADHLSLHMQSLLHYLRFYLPQGSNTLGESVEKIRFSMPASIAGSITASSADGSVSVTGGVTEMVLDCTLNESDKGEFALAAIIPPGRTYGPEEVLTARLYSDNYYADIEPLVLEGRSFEPGHVTTVALRPGEAVQKYKLRFTFGGSNLGEDIRSITVSVDDGTPLPETGSASHTYGKDGKALAIGESFSLSTAEEAEYRALDGKSITVSFESDNALVTRNFNISLASTGRTTDIALDCPYLFEQDFSEASTEFNKNGDLSASGHDGSMIEGSAYGLAGWTGNQVAILESGGNKALAIRHRNECAMWAQGTYRGRTDSPALTRIKEGHSVKVQVSFDYTGYTDGKQTPMISYGYDTATGDICGYYEGGSSAVKGGSKIAKLAGDRISAPKDGSISDINNSASFTIDGCTNAIRLSWDCYGSNPNSFKLVSYNEWVFIDNIKVSIIK